MAKNLEDKLFEGPDLAYAAGGTAVGIGLDLVGITDTIVSRLYGIGNLMITKYDALVPSFYNTVNYVGFDIAFFGSFFSAAANRPKGILLSWLAATSFNVGKAVIDYGAGYYVGSLSSVLAASVVATAGYVGLGLAAGYILGALWRKIFGSKKQE